MSIFFKERRVKKRQAIPLMLCIVLGAVVAGYVLFYSQFFLLQNITCVENMKPCSPDVLAELERHRGEHIFFIKTSAISEKIKKADATLYAVDIFIKFPQNMEVKLIKRISAIQFINSKNSPYVVFADREGTVLGVGERMEGLPIAMNSESAALVVGEKLPRNLMNASELLNALKDNLDVSSLSVIEADLLTATLKEGSTVRFSLTKSIASQMETLQLVLNQARIEQTPYREIDLRFLEPIIKK